MEYDKKAIQDYAIKTAQMKNFRYQVNTFDSGYHMIDIFKDSETLVIRLEDQKIGVSLIKGDDFDFSSIADIYFHNIETFKKYLNKLIGS